MNAHIQIVALVFVAQNTCEGILLQLRNIKCRKNMSARSVTDVSLARTIVTTTIGHTFKETDVREAIPNYHYKTCVLSSLANSIRNSNKG